MQEKIFIEQTPQEMLNIIEALQFYKNNAIKPKYKNIIDSQIESINKQLEIQEINILFKETEPLFNFGEKIKYDNMEGFVIGMSNEDNFIKILICKNNNIESIDVPIVLLEKYKGDN